MTKIQIDEINFKHFKGFEEYTITLNGKNAMISGKNGAGKTTIADGLQWLLFGKDTHGLKLNPKPVNQYNQEKLGLNPTVEAQLIIDGTTVTLKRVQEEKWAKKRGELEATRSSDTTKYFIDGVPKKEKEWKAYLESLGGEQQLQMLSNAAFFMTLNWTKRREILMEMSGVTDESVIASNPELRELHEALGDYTIDELKKILAGQKKEIKHEIESIPARIQENTDTIKSIQERIGDVVALEAELGATQSALEQAEEKLAVMKNGGASLDAKQELANLSLKLTEAERTFSSGMYLSTKTLQEDADILERQIRQKNSKLSGLQDKKVELERRILSKQNYRELMIAEYKRINAITFDEHATTCPTCGQDMPLEQIEQSREKFNQEKSEQLEANIRTVKEQKVTKEDLALDQNELDKADIAIQNAEKERDEITEKLYEINKELSTIRNNQGRFEETKEFKQLSDKIKVAEQKANQSDEDFSAEIYEAQENVNELRAKISDIQATLQEQKMIDQLNERINALSAQDGKLKKQNSDVERKLWLIDEFVRIKVSSIEESINNRFEIVKWKLFDVQKNGSINEKCEATFRGVEYASGLSEGEKGLVDVDIVKSLFKGHDMELPIFMDNDERITEPYTVPGQLIRLRAVPGVNKLEVEG